MSKKQKLELTWIGKDTRPKLEIRILREEAGEKLSRAVLGVNRQREALVAQLGERLVRRITLLLMFSIRWRVT